MSPLPRRARQVQLPLEEIKDKILDDIVKEAKRLAPVDTGRLRDSIRKEGDSVVVEVEYAEIVEFQHTPFLRPAIKRVKRRYGI